MTLTRMFDASTPPPAAYPGCGAVAGYIGGMTPHVWELKEWQRFETLRQLPIWVYGLADTPELQAVRAVNAAKSLGWKAHRKIRCVIALDMEMTGDEKFVAVFAETLHAYGFGCWVYGSAGYVFANPPADGYWVAAYPGHGPNLDGYQGEHVVAHQWAADVPHAGGAVDLSVVSDAGLAHLGRGPRRQVTP